MCIYSSYIVNRYELTNEFKVTLHFLKARISNTSKLVRSTLTVWLLFCVFGLVLQVSSWDYHRSVKCFHLENRSQRGTDFASEVKLGNVKMFTLPSGDHKFEFRQCYRAKLALLSLPCRCLWAHVCGRGQVFYTALTQHLMMQLFSKMGRLASCVSGEMVCERQLMGGN